MHATRFIQAAVSSFIGTLVFIHAIGSEPQWFVSQHKENVHCALRPRPLVFCFVEVSNDERRVTFEAWDFRRTSSPPAGVVHEVVEMHRSTTEERHAVTHREGDTALFRQECSPYVHSLPDVARAARGIYR